MRIIFVGYINRSGSTLLLSELSKVKGFVCLPESELLAKTLLEKPYQRVYAGSNIVKVLDKALQNDFKLSLFSYRGSFNELFGKQENELASIDLFFRFITRSAISENSTCTHIVFKNTHLPFIYKKIRKADIERYSVRLINLVRDPRAIYHSQKEAIGSWGKPMTSSPFETSLEWSRQIRWCENLMNVDDSKALELYYENLVSETNRTINNLILELGSYYELDESQPAYSKKIASNLKDIHENINKPITSDSSEIWKRRLSVTEIKCIEWVCRELLSLKGYTPIYKNPFQWHILIHAIPAYLRHITALKRGIHLPPNSRML